MKVTNNNPLNIRKSADRWQGQVLPQRGSGEGAFCQFETMEYGIRAAFCLLRTYATRYRLSSIRDIVMRWAPPSENDTQSYIRHVCLLTGFGGNQRLTEKDWPRLVKAMAKMESGIDLDDNLIQRAFKLYKHY